MDFDPKTMLSKAREVAAPLADAARSAERIADAIDSVANQADRARGRVDDALTEVGARRLEEVRYFLRVLDGPDPAWHVRRVSLTEHLGQPYELVLEVLTEDLGTDTDALLGASGVFDIERGGLLRSVAGIVRRVDDLGTEEERLHLRVHVVPALALLAQRVDTRIFQDVTVPEILAIVLEPELALFERELTWALGRDDYHRRDYCVQYRESDLDFVRRLMAEEGIAFYFEADDATGHERLVLVDDGVAFPAAPVIADGSVPIIEARAELASVESLRNFEWHRAEASSRVTVRRFNWKDPTALLEATASAPQPVRGRSRELYVHGDRRKIVDDAIDPAFDGTAVTEHEAEAPRRLARHMRGCERGHGHSNVTGFAAGSTFVLADHERSALAGRRFLLTGVVHEGDCPDEGRGATQDGPRYANRFDCIPDSVPFRMSTPGPKPRIPGPQTATVTGPAGEEIHVDAHGRIKVKFHWDRIALDDGNSSCWVRVAQATAGMGWGTLFTPRVGMEVVVTFLDGDPDQPLVTGAVYNGRNPPAYALPDDKTRTSIRTQSTPASDGYNEISFEDLAGAEQLLVRAQRDLDCIVGRDRSTDVTRNERISVGGSRVLSVGGSQRSSITGEQTTVVRGGLAALDVTGDVRATATDTALLAAPNRISIACQGSSITLDPTTITIVAGGGAKLVLDGRALIQAADGAIGQFSGDVELIAKDGAHLLLNDAALIEGRAGGYLRVDEEANLHGNGGGHVACTADVMCMGAIVTIAGKSANAEFAGDAIIAGANVTLAGSTKVEIGAPEVVSAADGTNTLRGATVKIN